MTGLTPAQACVYRILCAARKWWRSSGMRVQDIVGQVGRMLTPEEFHRAFGVWGYRRGDVLVEKIVEQCLEGLSAQGLAFRTLRDNEIRWRVRR